MSLFFIDIFKKKHKVYWSDETTAFNGIPFMVLNQKAFDCQHGKDRNINKKNKRAESSDKKTGNFLKDFLHSSKFTRGLNENLLLLKHCNFKVGLSPTKKISFYLLHERPLKMMKNAFYFILKALFVLTFSSCRRNGLIRKISLISKFLTSQPG